MGDVIGPKCDKLVVYMRTDGPKSDKATGRTILLEILSSVEVSPELTIHGNVGFFFLTEAQMADHTEQEEERISVHFGKQIGENEGYFPDRPSVKVVK